MQKQVLNGGCVAAAVHILLQRNWAPPHSAGQQRDALEIGLHGACWPQSRAKVIKAHAGEHRALNWRPGEPLGGRGWRDL